MSPEGHDRHAHQAPADLPDDGLSICAGRQPEGAGQHGRGAGAPARRDPEKLTYSSAGIGSGNHLSGALFAEAAGIALTHVPYMGAGPVLADVISGIITLNFSSPPPPAVPQVKAGNLKALAVTGDHRLSSLPDVPTTRTIADEHAFWGKKLKTLKIDMD